MNAPPSNSPAPGTPSRSRSNWAKGLALAFQLAACLAVWELAVRWTWNRPADRSTPAFQADAGYGFAPIPGASGLHVSAEYDTRFTHGARGFRSSDAAVDEPGSRQRLLVLGDSQTYGLGVSNGATFCDRIVESQRSSIALVNAGCNGYGTRNSLAVLHHFGAQWRPDRVWLVFFWNDLEDDWTRATPEFSRSAEGQLIRSDPPPADWNPLARLAQPPDPNRDRSFESKLARFLKEATRPWRYRRFGSKSRDIASPEDLDAAWEVQRELLGALRDRAAELGAELTILALPNQTQIDADAVIQSIRPLNYNVQDRLFEVCEELGLEALDLRPALREARAADSAPLFYYADRHLTARGHAVVAQALEQKLLAPETP